MEDRRVEVPIIGRNLYMWFWGKTLGPRLQAKSATKKGSVGQRLQSAQEGRMYREDRLHEMYDTRNKLQQTSMLDITCKATSWVANGWGRLQMWGDIQDRKEKTTMNAAQKQNDEWETKQRSTSKFWNWRLEPGQRARKMCGDTSANNHAKSTDFEKMQATPTMSAAQEQTEEWERK